MLGRRIDDPEVVAWVAELGKKLPLSTSERSEDANIEAPKAGIELVVSHQVLNEAYPPIRKTAKSFVPYVTLVWPTAKIGETILGIPWDVASEKDLTKVLGAPASRESDDDAPPTSTWTYPLDDGAKTQLGIEFRRRLRISLRIDEAKELERFERIPASLFIGWAATKGLLDASAIGGHAELLRAVSKRKAVGTELWDALGRGLWSSHLRNDASLRSHAYAWFHNLDDEWISQDLRKVFGERKGGGHEPKVDDASWANVNRAAPVFEKRFARWLKKG